MRTETETETEMEMDMTWRERETEMGMETGMGMEMETETERTPGCDPRFPEATAGLHPQFLFPRNCWGLLHQDLRKIHSTDSPTVTTFTDTLSFLRSLSICLLKAKEP